VRNFPRIIAVATTTLALSAPAYAALLCEEIANAPTLIITPDPFAILKSLKEMDIIKITKKTVVSKTEVRLLGDIDGAEVTGTVFSEDNSAVITIHDTEYNTSIEMDCTNQKDEANANSVASLSATSSDNPVTTLAQGWERLYAFTTDSLSRARRTAENFK
jgi:hypothetical protein